MIYIVLGNQKAEKNSLQATTFKVEENSRTFQVLAQKFKDSWRTSHKFQGLFKTVWALLYTIFDTKGNLPKSHFSSLLAAGDVLRGGTSAFQRQKFDTDGVKSVWNPIISAGWTTE